MQGEDKIHPRQSKEVWTCTHLHIVVFGRAHRTIQLYKGARHFSQPLLAFSRSFFTALSLDHFSHLLPFSRFCSIFARFLLDFCSIARFLLDFCFATICGLCRKEGSRGNKPSTAGISRAPGVGGGVGCAAAPGCGSGGAAAPRRRWPPLPGAPGRPPPRRTSAAPARRKASPEVGGGGGRACLRANAGNGRCRASTHPREARPRNGASSLSAHARARACRHAHCMCVRACVRACGWTCARLGLRLPDLRVCVCACCMTRAA